MRRPLTERRTLRPVKVSVALVAFLALAACGGGNGFDEDAVRTHYEQLYPGENTKSRVDALVDSIRDMCAGDDRTFEFLVAIYVDEGDTAGLSDLRRGCGDRADKVLADLP